MNDENEFDFDDEIDQDRSERIEVEWFDPRDGGLEPWVLFVEVLPSGFRLLGGKSRHCTLTGDTMWKTVGDERVNVAIKVEITAQKTRRKWAFNPRGNS